MSAASGAGKTTLKDLVIKDFPDIKYSISATTRAPREGEVNGVHYHFITDEKFRELTSDAKILYGILLDRVSLSTKNKWLDEKGISYTYRDIKEDNPSLDELKAWYEKK